MAAKIDLGWLAQLLTPTPTADSQANTPDLDPGSTGKFLDPNGILHGDTIDVTNPYQTPSNIQRMVWPTQAGAIDTLNNQASAYPRQQNLENQTQLGIRAGNIAKRPMAMQGIYNPNEEAAMGQGDLSQTPSDINAANAASIFGANSGPALNAAAQHNTATAQIEEAKARTLAASTGNVLGTPITQAAAENAGLNTALMSNAERQQVIPSELSRSLAENKLGTAEATGQMGLLPSKLSLSGTQLSTAIPIAEQEHSNLPFTLASSRAGAVRNLAETERMPVPPSYTDLVNPDTGGITFSKDPIGSYRTAEGMFLPGYGDMGMNMMNNQKGVTVKDSNGKSYTVKGGVSGVPNYPLGTPTVKRGLGGGTVIGGGSNNVTTSTPHDTSGSMNPPVPTESSSTTLRPSISSSITPLKQSNKDYTESASSDTLKNMLSKYGYSGEGDSKSVLEFMYKNMMSIPDEDRMQITNLLGKAK